MTSFFVVLQVSSSAKYFATHFAGIIFHVVVNDVNVVGEVSLVTVSLSTQLTSVGLEAAWIVSSHVPLQGDSTRQLHTTEIANCVFTLLLPQKLLLFTAQHQAIVSCVFNLMSRQGGFGSKHPAAFLAVVRFDVRVSDFDMSFQVVRICELHSAYLAFEGIGHAVKCFHVFAKSHRALKLITAQITFMFPKDRF